MTNINAAGSVDTARVVVITGAGGGIGAAMARSFAKRGDSVLVGDIEFDSAEEVAAGLRQAGARAIARRVDVGAEESVRELADTAFELFGRVDVLCNNAGVTLRPFRAAWDADARDYEWLMRVNYLGVVHGVLAFVPRMREQSGHKHLVNTSSLSTLVSAPGHAVYMASKAAVDSLSDSLRLEFAEHGDDFGVTVLYPGRVRTRIATSERLRPSSERSADRGVSSYPFTRARPVHNDPLDPETVGEMIAEAVDARRAYSLTHEADLSALRERADEQEHSFLPREAWAGTKDDEKVTVMP